MEFRTRFPSRRLVLVDEARFYLRETDHRELEEPGARPFVRAILQLLSCEAAEPSSEERFVDTYSAKIPLDDDWEPDLSTLKVWGPRFRLHAPRPQSMHLAARRIINLDELRRMARTAARKLYQLE
jgi:hypothetical protein